MVYVQETHIKKEHEKVLNCKWLGTVLSSSVKNKKNGVVICVKNPNLEAIDQLKDLKGRLKDPKGKYLFWKIKLPLYQRPTGGDYSVPRVYITVFTGFTGFQ